MRRLSLSFLRSRLLSPLCDCASASIFLGMGATLSCPSQLLLDFGCYFCCSSSIFDEFVIIFKYLLCGRLSWHHLYQNLYSLYLLGMCVWSTLAHTHTRSSTHTHSAALLLLLLFVVFFVCLFLLLKWALSKNNYVFWHMHAHIQYVYTHSHMHVSSI